MEAKTHERAIFGEVIVDADLQEVWEAWTTESGITSFFAPACNIDLRPDGPYEIFFDLEAPSGERGGEGMRIMSVQSRKMLSFTWNAPPSLPEVRGERTHVIVRIYQEQSGIRVTLHHDGWGTGGEWEEAYAYFQSAWKDVVLPRLRYRFTHGPIDWSDPPSLEDLAQLEI